MMVCVRIKLLLVVLFACLAPPALSRRQPPESGTAVAVTPVDDASKIYIVFCKLADCKINGHLWQDCYCCGNTFHQESCHPTMAECKAHCPVCNPTCSPAPPAGRSAMDGPAALAATDDAT